VFIADRKSGILNQKKTIPYFFEKKLIYPVDVDIPAPVL
jgi:hypothetical protein